MMTQHKNGYLPTTGIASSPKFSTLVLGARFICGLNLKFFDPRATSKSQI